MFQIRDGLVSHTFRVQRHASNWKLSEATMNIFGNSLIQNPGTKTNGGMNVKDVLVV